MKKSIIKSVMTIFVLAGIIILTGFGLGFVMFKMNNYGELVTFIWVASWFTASLRYHRELWAIIKDYHDTDTEI